MSKLLLDVNALVAWEHPHSSLHQRFHKWARNKARRDFRTCAITELGFIRVSMQGFGYTREQAYESLATLMRETGGRLDSYPAPQAASWIRLGTQTTDAYLIQLARANNVTLVTFDEGMPVTEVERIA